MKKENKLVVRKAVIKQLEREIQEEFEDKVKNNIKTLMKEIRMTEILLEKRRKQLEKLISGDKVYTEEELYYGN